MDIWHILLCCMALQHDFPGVATLPGRPELAFGPKHKYDVFAECRRVLPKIETRFLKISLAKVKVDDRHREVSRQLKPALNYCSGQEPEFDEYLK